MVIQSNKFLKHQFDLVFKFFKYFSTLIIHCFWPFYFNNERIFDLKSSL